MDAYWLGEDSNIQRAKLLAWTASVPATSMKIGDCVHGNGLGTYGDDEGYVVKLNGDDEEGYAVKFMVVRGDQRWPKAVVER